MVVAVVTLLVSDKENGCRYQGEKEKEDPCNAVHSALFAKTRNMFLVLHHKSVHEYNCMFLDVLLYMHPLTFLH